MSTNTIDEVITVEETVEKGYFYLENRQFHGPYETEEQAAQAAIENCNLTAPGERRAIYQGSAKRDNETKLNAPLSDMREISAVECPELAS